MESEIKMIIAVRRDLQMTRGKEIAQACHACLGAVLPDEVRTSDLTQKWIDQGSAKICVKVNSEQELKDLETKAEDAGINCCLITDAGRTMFHGIETPTCIALGPDTAEKLDPITGQLRLY
jgi:peptidyl-tRNA hydrolase, PTH2 family